MTADAPESGTQILPDRRARVRRHVSELFRLAGPIIVARLGVLLIVVTDAVMVGRAHTLELAYLAVGTIPFVPLLLTGLGLLMGTMVLTAEAFGAGDRLKCGEIWRRGMPYGLVLGVAGMAFCALGPAVLLILGQNPELAEGGGRVLQIFGLGLPAIMIFLATNFFLEGIKRPEPAMVLMIVANVLNVGFNWLLIEGQWGFPAWGADGAAVATTAIRYFLAVGLLIYVFWLLPERDTYGLGIKPAGGWRAWARQRELGYATGLAIGIESSAFAAMSVFAGWLGATSVAAYSIAYNVLGILFMIAIGFGGATAVRVGNAYGRRDAPDMVLAGWVGLGTNTVVAVVLGGGALGLRARDRRALYARSGCAAHRGRPGRAHRFRASGGRRPVGGGERAPGPPGRLGALGFSVLQLSRRHDSLGMGLERQGRLRRGRFGPGGFPRQLRLRDVALGPFPSA